LQEQETMFGFNPTTQVSPLIDENGCEQIPGGE
jgi:hypothetical protein